MPLSQKTRPDSDHTINMDNMVFVHEKYCHRDAILFNEEYSVAGMNDSQICFRDKDNVIKTTNAWFAKAEKVFLLSKTSVCHALYEMLPKLDRMKLLLVLGSSDSSETFLKSLESVPGTALVSQMFTLDLLQRADVQQTALSLSQLVLLEVVKKCGKFRTVIVKLPILERDLAHLLLLNLRDFIPNSEEMVFGK